jgi:hypothetical protein
MLDRHAGQFVGRATVYGDDGQRHFTRALARGGRAAHQAAACQKANGACLTQDGERRSSSIQCEAREPTGTADFYTKAEIIVNSWRANIAC